MSELAMIVGAGPGLSASLARLCASEGMGVVLAARNVAKLSALAEETGASTYACDASRREDVDALFDAVLDAEGVPDLVVFNASARVRGAVADVDPEAVARAIAITAYGGFLVGRRGRDGDASSGGPGSIQLLTGASARREVATRESGCFAMGKFRALRGADAQSMALRAAARRRAGSTWRTSCIDGGIGSDARVPGHVLSGSTRTRSRRPTCTSTASTAARGPGEVELPSPLGPEHF